MGRSLGPLRTGFRYGVVAVVIALVSDLRFLFVDPAGTPDWILTVFENYRTTLALAAFLFLGILAAIRVRPDRTEEGGRTARSSARLHPGGHRCRGDGGVTCSSSSLNATLFATHTRLRPRRRPSMVAYYERCGRMDDPRRSRRRTGQANLQTRPSATSRSLFNSSCALPARFAGAAACCAISAQPADDDSPQKGGDTERELWPRGDLGRESLAPPDPRRNPKP